LPLACVVSISVTLISDKLAGCSICLSGLCTMSIQSFLQSFQWTLVASLVSLLVVSIFLPCSGTLASIFWDLLLFRSPLEVLFLSKFTVECYLRGWEASIGVYMKTIACRYIFLCTSVCRFDFVTGIYGVSRYRKLLQIPDVVLNMTFNG
jgi:hypothetical protein